MKVCHIMTHPISRNGGTEIAVANIKQDYDVKNLGTSGPFLYLKSFLLAVRLVFSDYDIIHNHDMAGYGYTFVPRFMRKKVVYSCHGLWETYFEGRRTIMTRFLIRAQKRIIKNSDIVVATSRFRKKEIMKLYNVDAEYVHNGVDTDKFRPIKMKKEFDFLWVGSNRAKGLDFALKLSKEGNKKLLVVGLDGQNTQKIKYIKSIPHEKMPDIYNKCRTLVNYSTISRYDFVVLEAMACGINVIINKESAEELMPDKHFSGKIIFLSKEKGRKISKSLSWKSAIAEYNDIYRRMTA